MFTIKKYVDLIVDSEEDIELKTMNETVKSERADLSFDDLKTISDKQMLTDNVINPFPANDPILYPLKTPESLWFSGVFRGYKMGTLAGNGLMSSKKC